MAATLPLQQKTLDFLNGLIRIPSTRGHEGPASRYVAHQIAAYVSQCSLVPVPESIQQDPDYAFPLPNLTYQDTPNVECLIQGKGQAEPIIFNAHLDVVPPSEGQVEPFNPRLENGIIYGRGACDDKGPLATLFALAALLRERGIQPPGDLIFHFVIEEENGGNGTLAMIRRGVKASAAVVLEPTDLAIIPAVRGAVWFTLTLYGKAGHSGHTSGRVSALDKAFEAIQILKRYLEFNMLNNDGNMIPVDHPLVIALRDALVKNQLPPIIRAQTAACDAWQYNNVAGIPSVVFGPDSLAHAHSREEQIRLSDILQAAQVLADFVTDFDRHT